MIARVSQRGDCDGSNNPVVRIVRLLQEIGCPEWKREGKRSYLAIAGVDVCVMSPSGRSVCHRGIEALRL